MLTITPIYAGLIALLFVALSFRVSQLRIARQVSYGDGGDGKLAKAIRVQANCAEYAPIGLILLGLAEMQGAPDWTLHLFGLMLLGGRVLHALGYGGSPQNFRFRQTGMILTYAMIALAGIANLGHALF